MEKGTKNKVTVIIHGQKYNLVGNESPFYIQQVAEYVDQKMKELSQKNTKLDMTRMAVLTAVNMAEEYLDLHKEYERLQQSYAELQKKEHEVQQQQVTSQHQTAKHNQMMRGKYRSHRPHHNESK